MEEPSEDQQSLLGLNLLLPLPMVVTAKSHHVESTYQDGGPSLSSCGGDGETTEEANVQGVRILSSSSVISSYFSESWK